MKRLFACAVAGGLIVSAFSSADAARKKSTTKDGLQSLRIPAVRVSSKSTHKSLAAPKLPVAKKTLEPVPEDPSSVIFRAPVLPPDPAIEPVSHLVIPATPKLSQVSGYRPQLPPDPQIVGPPLIIDQHPGVVEHSGVSEPVVIDFQPVAEAPTIQLFEKVRYTGKRKVAPNAVTKLVVIRDPSQPKRTAPTCRNCVAIEICVPPCACETVKANKAENVVRYNYGKYGVEIRIKRGRVVVHYHARSKA